jgi:opine dehydrogenase
MNIAVLGSGNGGCGVAFDCAQHGHDVTLFDLPDFPENVAAVAENGGITSEGELEGFAPVRYAGHDIREALEGAELIYAVGPAYSTRPFAQAAAPHLKAGQTVVICPGSTGGAIEFKHSAGLALEDQEILVAETSTLPYAVRITAPGKIRVFLKLKDGLLLAAMPAAATNRVLEALCDVYPATTAAKNVLQTSLQNGNPVIHPSVTLLNAALIERTGGDFFFYEEGVTPGVGRLMAAVDRERVALGEKLGVDVLPDPEIGYRQGYMAEPTYDRGYSEAPGFKGIKAQGRLDHRYLHEDVGYGLVFLQDLGRQIGVETPTMSAVIAVASAVMQRDYVKEAKRTMESLGLAGLSVEELQELVA